MPPSSIGPPMSLMILAFLAWDKVAWRNKRRHAQIPRSSTMRFASGRLRRSVGRQPQDHLRFGRQAAYDAGDYPAAYKIWSGIDRYDLAAMRNVAMMLRTGQGVQKDPKKARGLVRRSRRCRPAHRPGRSGRHAAEGRGRTARSQARPAAAWKPPRPPTIRWRNMSWPRCTKPARTGWCPRTETVARRLYTAAAGHGMKEAQARLDALGPEPAPPPAAPATQAANPPATATQPVSDPGP